MPTATHILHLGWANQAARAARHQRYVEADGGRFHRSSHLDSILWPDNMVTLRGRPWPAFDKEIREAITTAAS